MKKLLIVVDMQNDFVTGVLGTPEARVIVPTVAKKVRAEHAAGRNVMFTKDVHFRATYSETQEGQKIPPHCLYGTDGYLFVPELKKETLIGVDSGDFLVDKHSFAVTPAKLASALSHRGYGDADEFELCGVCSDICVIANAVILKGLFPEAKITVDSKAVAGTTPAANEAALTVMRSLQINVI